MVDFFNRKLSLNLYYNFKSIAKIYREKICESNIKEMSVPCIKIALI